MEAAVTSVAVDDVGPYPAAHPIRRLEYYDVDAGAGSAAEAQARPANPAPMMTTSVELIKLVPLRERRHRVVVGWARRCRDAVAPDALSAAAASTARTGEAGSPDLETSACAAGVSSDSWSGSK